MFGLSRLRTVFPKACSSPSRCWFLAKGCWRSPTPTKPSGQSPSWLWGSLRAAQVWCACCSCVARRGAVLAHRARWAAVSAVSGWAPLQHPLLLQAVPGCASASRLNGCFQASPSLLILLAASMKIRIERAEIVFRSLSGAPRISGWEISFEAGRPAGFCNELGVTWSYMQRSRMHMMSAFLSRVLEIDGPPFHRSSSNRCSSFYKSESAPCYK